MMRQNSSFGGISIAVEKCPNCAIQFPRFGETQPNRKIATLTTIRTVLNERMRPLLHICVGLFSRAYGRSCIDIVAQTHNPVCVPVEVSVSSLDYRPRGQSVSIGLWIWRYRRGFLPRNCSVSLRRVACSCSVRLPRPCERTFESSSSIEGP